MSVEMPPWRVIIDRRRPGVENMALDEALMRCQALEGYQPTLRFYGWRPACLSLGYFQRVGAEVDEAACAAGGVDVVRRPTGGRAVLHDDEVTYSVVVRDELLPGSVRQTYLRLSQGLLQGLRYLGVEGELVRAAAAGRGAGDGPGGVPGDGSRAACFDAPSWYELLVNGRKLIGSAQTRRDGVVLQHGSVLVTFAPGRLAALLRLRSDEARQRVGATLAGAVTSLAEQLGRRPRPGEVERALACGMARGLGVPVCLGGYTAREIELAKQLADTKYSTADWTRRR